MKILKVISRPLPRRFLVWMISIEITQTRNPLGRGIEIIQTRNLLGRGIEIIQTRNLLGRGIKIIQTRNLLGRGIKIIQTRNLLGRGIEIIKTRNLLGRGLDITFSIFINKLHIEYFYNKCEEKGLQIFHIRNTAKADRLTNCDSHKRYGYLARINF